MLKSCSICGQLKPGTEFYKHPSASDGLHYYCKDCYRAKRRLHAIHPKNHAARNYEAILIEKLRSVGIYATTGKCSEWKWLDIVAWGCVKIETKAARERAGKFQFSFVPQRRKSQIDADIVLLVCFHLDLTPTYYLFPATHPVFCRTSGELKKGIAWTQGAKPKPKPGQGISLTDELMTAAKDNWEIIERVRKQTIAKLQNNLYG